VVNGLAYYTDAPHNESNGLACHICHSNAAFSWSDPTNGTGDIDVTFPNTVCLQCHAGNSVDPYKGPSASLHASSNGGSLYGTWSTRCTDCHDPHFQGQLDYAASDPDKLFLANGKFTEAIPSFAPADPDSTTYGASTIGFDQLCSVTPCPDWNDVDLWAEKGGHRDKNLAVDSSRGLILVPNKSNPADTYEIIRVTNLGGSNYEIKVKGQMSNVVPGQQFGVIYGQSIKSAVHVSNDLPDRGVKFFLPDVISGDHGGYIDDNPATRSTTPLGLCQVCHTLATYWRDDGSAPAPHTSQDCDNCHAIHGGCGGCGTHAAFLGDVSSGTPCADCHGEIVADAGVNHPNCTTCHTAAVPAINSNPYPGTGNPPDTGADVIASLTDNGNYIWNGSSRLEDLGGFTVAPVHVGFFDVIKCDECHDAKPQGLIDGIHPNSGHFDSHFSWDGNCADCHLTGTEPVVSIVHADDCDLCHTGGTYNASTNGIGTAAAAANGVDGDAGLAEGDTGTWMATCTTCHSVNTPAGIHHDSASGLAAAGNCIVCHNGVGAGGHAGDHQALVTDVAPCDGCHTATSPVDADNVPVDGVGGNRIHNACIDCHDTGSPIMALRPPYGNAQAMPSGPVGSDNGGGNCVACHTSYFDAHTHGTGTNHFVSMKGSDLTVGLSCSVCHGPLTTWAGIATLHDKYDGNGSGPCAPCHNSPRDNLSDPGSIDARFIDESVIGVITEGGSGNPIGCLDCHVEPLNPHPPSGSCNVLPNAQCVSCHTENVLTGIHSTGDCVTCHTPSTGLVTLNAGTSAEGHEFANGPATCTICHAAYFAGHDHADMATATFTGVNIRQHALTSVALCENCHTTYTPGAALSVDIHDVDGCLTCHNTSTGNLQGSASVAIGNEDCQGCHVGYFDDHQHPHATTFFDPATDLYVGQPCSNGGCHAGEVENWSNILTRHDNYEQNGPSVCDTCHNATRDTSESGLYSVGLTIPDIISNGGTVNCLDCHIDEGGGGAGH